MIRLRHRTRCLVGVWQIASYQGAAVHAVPLVFDCGSDACLHFVTGIKREGMAEVLHDEKAVSIANHAQPDHVVSRVEQVRTVGG